MVEIHDEFFVGHNKPAFEPARRMPDLVAAGQERGPHRSGAVLHGLPVGRVGRGNLSSAGPDRHAQSPAELGQRHRRHIGLGRTEGQRAGFQVHGGVKAAEDDRASRPDQLGERYACHRLGQCLRRHGGGRQRTHCSGEDRRRHANALVRRRIDAQRTGHGVIIDQRGVHIDIGLHYRIGVHEIAAEDQSRHVDGVLRAFRRCDSTHERLRRQRQMRQHHVEVPLVHRHVRRFDDRAAGMVKPWREV